MAGANVTEYSGETKASLQWSVLGVMVASIGFWVAIGMLVSRWL